MLGSEVKEESRIETIQRFLERFKRSNDHLNSLLAETTKVITFVCMDTSK